MYSSKIQIQLTGRSCDTSLVRPSRKTRRKMSMTWVAVDERMAHGGDMISGSKWHYIDHTISI